MRFPVAAKIALHTAGAVGGVAGSPTPPRAAVLGTLWPGGRPRGAPAGGAAPHPALLAARLRAPGWRGALPSRSRRYSYGSFLAAWASSSMNVSTANALYELFTDRQKPTGIPVSVRR